MESARKQVTIGKWEGQGPLPGYRWTILILTLAFEDMCRLLDEDQRTYVTMQVQDLAMHLDPSTSLTQSIDRIETFYEIRLKGGGVGPRINIRVYYDFVTLPSLKAIRILGVDKKGNEGHIMSVVKDRILRRQRRWNDGYYPLDGV